MTTDRMGRQRLHYAALEDDLSQAELLIQSGADLNAQDSAGLTALHFAAQKGSIRVARLLLDRGANVNIEDEYGNAPLWTAVFNSRGDGAMIQLLRDHGADPTRPNKSGKTPAQLARMIGNFPVAQWFSDVPELNEE
jgi:ankyrin repeat protein